jgi:hypothetical protein
MSAALEMPLDTVEAKRKREERMTRSISGKIERSRGGGVEGGG